MGRYAYLICCHDNFAQAAVLVSLLDDVRNAIYVNLDGKVKMRAEAEQQIRSGAKKAKVFFVDPISVQWGGYSLIAATLQLLSAASTEHYDYYHFLSGKDLPLCTQDEMHDFFDGEKKEFVNFSIEKDGVTARDRYQYYWFFQDRLSNIKNKAVAHLLSVVQNELVSLQKVLHVDRTRKNSKYMKFAKGSQWFSITDGFAQYILQRKPWIERQFRFGMCVDEMFVQTLLLNSPFYTGCFHPQKDDDWHGNMRYIDWERGAPYVFHAEDVPELLQTGAMFARKFDDKIDLECIQMIQKYLQEKNESSLVDAKMSRLGVEH